MQQIELDASNWKNPSDFYDALLSALGAPDWHGRNFDALWDSIVTGDINKVEPPFEITVRGWPITDSAALVLQRFIDLIRKAAVQGVPVTIQTSVSN